MKINHKIEIDILNVFKTGKFEFVSIGKTKNWILNNFQEPDDFADGVTLESATVWRYGNIEFYFLGDSLIQIFTDYITQLDAGPKIQLEKWIFNEPQKLSLQYVIEHLINERIDFVSSHNANTYIPQTSIGLLNSLVHLNFQPEETEDYLNIDNKSPNQYILQSISILNNEDFNMFKNNFFSKKQ